MLFVSDGPKSIKFRFVPATGFGCVSGAHILGDNRLETAVSIVLCVNLNDASVKRCGTTFCEFNSTSANSPRSMFRTNAGTGNIAGRLIDLAIASVI